VITDSDVRRFEEIARSGEEPTDDDLRAMARALREVSDDARLALFRKLLKMQGVRALAEMLVKILRADGFPAPAKGAARIIAHLMRGTELTRRGGGSNMSIDMSWAAHVAQRLVGMGREQALGVLGRRRAEVGEEQFAKEAAILTAAARSPAGANLSRQPGDVGTVRDTAAVVPRRVPMAPSNDPAYVAVLRQSGRR